MRLTDHVTLVASGAYGFDLSDPLDCHVYLVRGARDSALVDAVLPSEPLFMLECLYVVVETSQPRRARLPLSSSNHSPCLRKERGLHYTRSKYWFSRFS